MFHENLNVYHLWAHKIKGTIFGYYEGTCYNLMSRSLGPEGLIRSAVGPHSFHQAQLRWQRDQTQSATSQPVNPEPRSVPLRNDQPGDYRSFLINWRQKIYSHFHQNREAEYFTSWRIFLLYPPLPLPLPLPPLLCYFLQNQNTKREETGLKQKENRQEPTKTKRFNDQTLHCLPTSTVNLQLHLKPFGKYSYIFTETKPHEKHK